MNSLILVVLFAFAVCCSAVLENCSMPRQLAPCAIDRDAIDVVVVTHSWAREADLERATYKLLKSIALSTMCPVWFHLVCAGDDCHVLSRNLRLFGEQRPHREPALRRITTTLYSVNVAQMATKWKVYGNNRMHHSGLPGLVKFYLDEVFSLSVSRVLCFDTDMLVAGDIQEIYRMAFMSHTDRPYTFAHNSGGPCGICSCLFAVDLDQVRRLGGAHNLFLAVPRANRRFALGDQSLYQSICYRNATLFGKLGEEWNRSFCQVHDNITATVRRTPCYKAAHFNCHFKLSEFDPRVLSIYAADTAFVEALSWSSIS